MAWRMTFLPSGVSERGITVRKYSSASRLRSSKRESNTSPNGSKRCGASAAVDAAASTFGYSGSFTNPNKPASDLTWATASGGPFSSNAGTAATLLSGSIGTSGTSQTIFFRTTLSYAVDPPGSYTLTVRYTLSAP